VATHSPIRTVRVPASTSNLGPGFDLLGLALDLWLEARLMPAEVGTAGLVRLDPPLELPGDPASDLTWIAFEAARARWPFEGLHRIEVRSDIPVGRGLGSSGAAVAAGLLLARMASGVDVPDEALLRLGVELEGHPDNVAAALTGGLTLCQQRADGTWRTVSVEMSAEVGIAIAWPRTPLATPQARAVLPAEVPFADAVENPRRLAFLLEGLRRADGELIAIGCEDRLHVRYRLPLLPGSARALERARAVGAWGATLSGAGSGLVALGPPERMPAVATAMAAALREATGAGEGRVLAVAPGARIV
jgi:homoserine kinase